MLRTWTINEYSANDQVEWHGLFYRCNRVKCELNYEKNFSVIFISIMGVICLGLATIFVFLMGVHSFPRRHFYITPLICFVAVMLMFAGLVLYANRFLLNGLGARMIITAIVLVYTSLAIVSFVAGRYSIFYKQNPMDFSYRKTEGDDATKKVEVQQTL